MWCVEEPKFSEGFMRRCVGAVRYRGAGALPVVLDAAPLRRPSVHPRHFLRRRRTVGENNAAGGLQQGRGTKALLVPQLHVVVVVSAGVVQGAAAAHSELVRGSSAHRRRGVHLREAGLSPGAVVDVLDRIVFSVAGRELQLLANRSGFGGRRSESMAAVVRHFEDLNPGFVEEEGGRENTRLELPPRW